MKDRPRIRTVRRPCARCGKPCIRPDGLCTPCAKEVPRSVILDRPIVEALARQPVRFLAARAQRVRQHTERIQSALTAGRR